MSYAALGSQSEDMDAINRYIMTTTIVTDAARKLKDEWLGWYDNLSWYSKSYDQDTYDEARNRRNAFNLANTRTSAERDVVKRVIKTGLTTEEMEGGTRRMTSEGQFGAGKPLLSDTTKLLLVLGAGASLYLYFGWVRPGLKLFRRRPA